MTSATPRSRRLMRKHTIDEPGCITLEVTRFEVPDYGPLFGR